MSDAPKGTATPRSRSDESSQRQRARRRRMLTEVLDGLARPQKELSPKYFYDHRGSELFERITRLPEYYLTRTEEALLEADVAEWVEALAPRALVELGAGSARKTRVLLDAMVRAGSGEVFVPVDVSGDFLRRTVAQVREEYPDLAVQPLVADITLPLRFDEPLPCPVLFVLLGSTIGNFTGDAAVGLLTQVAAVMDPEDRLLVGADLRPGQGKTAAEIEAAYNDRAGVTAAFNRNVLAVINHALGSDFDPDRFDHLAFYDPGEGQVEMHLRSLEDQVVTFPEHGHVTVARGETIRTEISAKYDRQTLDSQFGAAGLVLDRWIADRRRRFSLSLWRPDPDRERVTTTGAGSG